eukprot:COSAG05_NODE_2313_length_3242_cov_13.235762_2_plen_72_part_00
MMPPLLNPARERATDAPLSDFAEGDGGHARAGKWPVSEYGRKCRRLPPTAAASARAALSAGCEGKVGRSPF